MAEHGGRIVAKVLKSRGVEHAVHALGRPPLLDLRRLQSRGDPDRRRPPRADRRLRRRGDREGDPRGRRRGADRRAGRDQRDERDRRRPGQQLADLRARRAGAGDALGLGLAAGDRPPAVRLAAGQVGGDGEGDRRDRGDDRGGARPRRRRAERPDLPRLPDGRRLLARPSSRCPPRRARPTAQPAAGVEEAAALLAARRAAGDHGRHRPLLGARRGASCGRWPRRSASRSSSTASAAAACPPTTTSPSAAPARPRCRAPTSRSWSACRWTSGSASAAASARRRRSSASTSRRTR